MIADYIRIVRTNRNFRLLWGAQIISEIGDWLYAVAVYSLLLDYTGSAKAVATAFVLQVLPQFFVSPAAGVINDRMSRRQVMMFADWTRAVIVAGMLLVRGPQMVPFLYLLLFLETIMWALFEPGRNSVIPNITPRQDVVPANGLASITWSFNLAVGAAIGGGLAAVFGRNAVFTINSLSFIVSGMLIRKMRFTEPHLAQVPAVTWRNMLNFSPFVEGLRYVRKDARLTATLFVKCGLGLMGTNWVILPLLGERVFPFGGMDPQRGGMLAMSLLMASRGIGALAGPLIAGWWAGRLPERLRAGILAGFIVGGAGYFLLGQAQSLWVACLTIAFAHSGGSTIWVFSTTLLQLQTDDRFRGRVFSTEFGFNMLTMSTVSYTAGVLADRRVPPATLAVYTSVAVLFAGLVWAAALRKFWPRVEVTHSEVKA